MSSYTKLTNTSTSSLRTNKKHAVEMAAYYQKQVEDIDTELEKRKASGQLKAEKRVTYRQIGGDDGYHYCVLVDGRVVANGMMQREAQYEKQLQVKRLIGTK